MSFEPQPGVEPHRGTTIMVLGILSLFVANIILGPIAWIMGNNDLKKMRAGQMDRSGESNTNTGRICGIVGTILGAAGLCCLIGGLTFGFGTFFFAAREAQQHQEKAAPFFKDLKPERPPFDNKP
jgi:hypothetical protein